MVVAITAPRADKVALEVFDASVVGESGVEDLGVDVAGVPALAAGDTDEMTGLSNHFRRQLPLLGELPRWESRYRIGPRQPGLILRRSGEDYVWSLAVWGLMPPGAKTRPPQVLTNARDDKLASWPWNSVVRRGRCLILADGLDRTCERNGLLP